MSINVTVSSDDELIDQIYEAAAVPRLWRGKGVLDLLARVADCSDAAFFAVDHNGINGWAANERCFEKMQIYVADNWVSRNPYLETVERQQLFNEPRFLLDTEVMSTEEMAASPYYQGFMKPQGVYWHTGTSVASPTGDVLKISVHRSFESGPIKPEAAQRLTALRPHIARAALLTARLRFEQVRAAVEAFDVIGLGAAAMRMGRLVTASKTFEGLMPSVVQDRRTRLTFKHPAADKCFQAIVESRLKLGGSFPVAGTEQHPTLVAHVIPVVGAGHDIFNVADSLLILTSATEDASIDPLILEGLFDLTAAEAAVCRDLTLGRNLKSIAQGRRVSIETVRSQLRAIFSKTGTNRQVDLVRMLEGLRTVVVKPGINYIEE